MADPLSIVAGIAGTTAFALQAVKSTITTIQSIKATNNEIINLRHDLESLQTALESLTALVHDHSGELALLEEPLRCCGRTCNDFARLMQDFASPSRLRLIDWAKLRIKDQGVSAIRTNLAVYKSTICVAIGGLNLRQNLATKDLVADYQTLVLDTSTALKNRISELSELLKARQIQENAKAVNVGSAESSLPTAETLSPAELLEEKRSAQLCLQVCDQAAGSLLRLNASISRSGDRATMIEADPGPSARGTSVRMTTRRFGQAGEELRTLRAELGQLHERYDSLLERINASTPETMTSEEIAELKTGFSQCLSVCQKGTDIAANARISEYENITGGARSHQWILSNFGDLLRVKGATVEDDGLQIIGQVDSEVSRQLSSDYTKVRHSANASNAGRQQDKAGPTQQHWTNESQGNFLDRFGEGSRLG